MRNKTLVLLMALLCVNIVNGVEPIWQGNGVVSDPYQIGNAEELMFLGENPEFYSDEFILTSDIDLEPNAFTTAVIARDGDSFTGVFDGNYHKICNLTIDTQSSGSDYIGLFGKTSGADAEIMNLGLENVEITIGDSDDVGAMVGYNNCNISNCYATGSITSVTGASSIGGFLGVAQGTIINCYTDVDVAGSGSSVRVGGFTGHSAAAYLNCYASGSVTGGTPIGGFFGQYLLGYSYNIYHLHPDDGGGPVDSVAAALTDAEMKEQVYFTGWDFIGETTNGIKETWVMDGYPALTWQVPTAIRELGIMSSHWGQTYTNSDDAQSRADWYEDYVIDAYDLTLLAESWCQRVVVKEFPFSPDDDFETGDFSKQAWVQGGDADWVIDSDEFRQGEYSARSGVISNIESSELELTVDTTGYDLITFYYKVSSEDGFDFFHFYIDGSRMIEHGGESGWVYATFPVSDGGTTFKWVYSKDNSGNDGSDCAWLDNIVFVKE